MAQRSRNVLLYLDDRSQRRHFLIHDRDAKLSRVFDSVIRSERIEIIRTPVQAPTRTPTPSGGSGARAGSASTGS